MPTATGSPRRATARAQTTPVTALAEPIDRSIPPAMIRKVMPTEAIISMATCRSRPIRFSAVRKVGLAMERKTKMTKKTTKVAKPCTPRKRERRLSLLSSSGASVFLSAAVLTCTSAARNGGSHR